MAIQKIAAHPGGGLAGDASVTIQGLTYQGPAQTIYVHVFIGMAAGWNADKSANSQPVFESFWTAMNVPASVTLGQVATAGVVALATDLGANAFLGIADAKLDFSSTNPNSGVTPIGSLFFPHVYDMVAAGTVPPGQQVITAAAVVFS